MGSHKGLRTGPTKLNAKPAHGPHVAAVNGWWFNGRSFVKGSVSFDDRVITATSKRAAKSPLATGIVIPGFHNAHTHLGDAVVRGELRGSLQDLVAPPHGLKHRELAKARDEDVAAAVRRVGRLMVRTGTSSFADFREGGLPGLRVLYRGLLGVPLRVSAFGRPVGLRYDREEVESILRTSDGIGVSSYIDWPEADLADLAHHVKRRGKLFALHCSERVREPIDKVLRLKPDLLVHMVRASDGDLERCADAAVPIVSCPRSNVFFGQVPDIPRMLRHKVTLLLGTDNAMINAPSMLREMEFAYKVARLKGEIAAKDILGMAVRGRTDEAREPEGRLEPGASADLVVFALPGSKSAFATLLRATEGDIALVVTRGVPYGGRDRNRQRTPVARRRTPRR